MAAQNFTKLCLLLLLACATIQTDAQIHIGCPSDPCRCNGGSINCTCTERQDILIDKLIGKNISNLEIHGCGTVKIGMRAFLETSLTALVLQDLEELIVGTLAFTGADHLNHITISDVTVFSPMGHSFYGLKNISQISLINLTSNSLPEGFLYVHYLEHFLLSELTIGAVEQKAIRVDICTLIIISNSSMGRIEDGAIHSPGGIEHFILYNNTMETVSSQAFTLNVVGNFITNSCRIDSLESRFIEAEAVSSYWFHNNTVYDCESGAFAHVNPIHGFSFQLNTFRNAHNESLLSLSELNATSMFHIENNRFQCDCQLEWLWSPEYGIYRNSSFCVDKESVLSPMSDFTIVMDNGTCIVVDSTVDDPQVQSVSSWYPNGTESVDQESEKTFQVAPVRGDASIARKGSQLCFLAFFVSLALM